MHKLVIIITLLASFGLSYAQTAGTNNAQYQNATKEDLQAAIARKDYAAICKIGRAVLADPKKREDYSGSISEVEAMVSDVCEANGPTCSIYYLARQSCATVESEYAYNNCMSIRLSNRYKATVDNLCKNK